MPALIEIKRRLARLPARVPDGIAVLDVIIASAIIHRHSVISIPQDPAELGVLAEAIATGSIGDEGEEILRAHVVDPRPRGGGIRDDVLAVRVVEMSVFFHLRKVYQFLGLWIANGQGWLFHIKYFSYKNSN
jgi:hypothetical protein